MTLRLPAFELLTPETLEQAVTMLADPAATVIGGGTDLLPKMKRRQATPPTVVSLRAIAELRGIRTDEQGCCVIGASTLLEQIVASTEVPPVLATSASTLDATTSTCPNSGARPAVTV